MKNSEVADSIYHPHTLEFRDFSHGVLWRFRFQSLLPGSDRCDGGGQTAGPMAGDPLWRFASKIEEKLSEKTLRIQWLVVDQHVPPIW